MQTSGRCRSTMKNGELVMEEAKITDKAVLADILADLEYMKEFTGWNSDDLDEAQNELSHCELPPNGVPESDRIYLISFRGRQVGYTKFYEGAPNRETAFLGFLGIKRQYQNQGIAKLALDQIENELKERGYQKIRINVGTRNLPAMKFWIRNGFTRIVGHSDAAEGFLDINLEKIIFDREQGQKSELTSSST